MNPIAIMLISVVFGFAAQMNLKIGVTRLKGVNFASAAAGKDLIKTFTNPFLMGALLMYFLSFVMYIQAIDKMDISQAYPMASLNLVLISLAARFVFREKVNALRWAGVGMVLCGVILLSQSGG